MKNTWTSVLLACIIGAAIFNLWITECPEYDTIVEAKQVQQVPHNQCENAFRDLLKNGEYDVSTANSNDDLRLDDYPMVLYPEHGPVHYLSNFVRRGDTWENWDTGVLKFLNLTKFPRGKLFVDVGSSIGWWTLRMAKQGFRVKAFEPDPKNLRLNRASQCLNKDIMKNIELFPYGVAESDKSCSIITAAGRIGNSILDCGDINLTRANEFMNGKVTDQIEIRKLDNFVQEDVYMIKIDCEGCELNALRGAKNLLKNYNVSFILQELNPGQLFAHNSSEDACDALLQLYIDFGFTLYSYDKKTLTFTELTQNRLRCHAYDPLVAVRNI